MNTPQFMRKYEVVEDKRPSTHIKQCPACNASIEYWWTSGMSECFPHFYCEGCGEAIWRERDKVRIFTSHDEAELKYDMKEIVDNLPPCRCGGRYTIEAGPRCPDCRFDFADRSKSFSVRAYDPSIILLRGSRLYTEH
jgi:transposase-like protein